MAQGIAKSQRAEKARARKISEARRKKMLEQGFLNSPKARQRMAAAKAGQTLSAKTRAKISAALKGSRPANFDVFLAAAHAAPKACGPAQPNWKGNKVSYNGLHHWVNRFLGKPSKCEHCGSETAGRYDWANKSGKYRRVLSDWLRLCKSCHKKYDIKQRTMALAIEVKET